ncbi:unnamed protein product [Caenorhabditis nigoni]
MRHANSSTGSYVRRVTKAVFKTLTRTLARTIVRTAAKTLARTTGRAASNMAAARIRAARIRAARIRAARIKAARIRAANTTAKSPSKPLALVHDRSKLLSAPLRRKKMPDGSWITLPWIKPEGYKDDTHCNHALSQHSQNQQSSNEYTSHHVLPIKASIGFSYKNVGSAEIQQNRAGNTSAPLRRKKLADGTWQTQKWIKPEGYVQSSHSA